MAYRTKTYIAGDWTGDSNLIEQIYRWNDSNNCSLNFIDAHELTQARDTSLFCSVKESLARRLDVSKTFVLIVGEETNSLTKGSCAYCRSYSSWLKYCVRGNICDYNSYIRYECEKAVRDGLRIVVIYNYGTIRRDKCPKAVLNTGTHINGIIRGTDGWPYWNTRSIISAIMG